MPTKKTKSPPQGYSVNALSKLTGRDRRTLDKLLVNVAPVANSGGKKLYSLAAVEAELAKKPKVEQSLKDQKTFEEVRKLRIANDAKEGRLVPRDQYESWIAKVRSGVDVIIEQKLVNEYPSAVAGMDVPQARIFGKRLGDQLREEFGKLAHIQ